MGEAPLNIKIFGDPDGTFHDFGSYYYVVRAIPTSTNQFVQTKVFRTGHLMTPEDRIPSKIYFDMSRPAPPPTYYYGAPPAYPLVNMARRITGRECSLLWPGILSPLVSGL